MDQQRLIFEDVNDALGEVVRALGGAKLVGARMRPELPADQAGNWIRDCLNANRRERFDPDQVLLLLRWGREVSCHAAMHYLTGEAGYETPRALSPKDEAALLMERAGQLAKESRNVADALDRLARAPLASVGAKAAA